VSGLQAEASLGVPTAHLGVLLFGMNQAWNRGQKEVTIHLTDRIVVSPYAAKRLSMLLQGVVNEYEKRFGTLNIDMPGGDAKK
jgi:hypothetical protein